MGASTDAERTFLTALDGSSTPLSRAEIARQSGFSKPAISTAAQRLTDRGLVRAVGVLSSGRGGVATLFSVNPAAAQSMAMVIEQQVVRVRSTALDGNVLLEAAVELGAESGHDDIVRAANSLIAEAQAVSASPLAAVCVSMAIPVEKTSGVPATVNRSTFTAGRIDIRRELDLPAELEVVIDNDVNWLTLAEHHLGVAQDENDFVYVYLGEGLGAGLFVGGQLQRGSRGLAGEVGYLRDSVEFDLTERLALLGLARTGGYGLDPVAIAGRDLNDFPGYGEIVERLGLQLANLVITLDPSLMVLGGPLSELSPLVEDVVALVGRLVLSPVAVVHGTLTPIDGASFRAHALAREAYGF